ncbi:AMIN-like domain-containing (lipo)protein [Nocardia sp. FBN12]|uniref:AMIN-like domain-containing (lipo)protein n=1 Tax=Nocardia sp. FBN12 TaxID=3419766 RepID=UPI003D00B153
MRNALVFVLIAAAAVSMSGCGTDDAPATAPPATTSTTSTFADATGEVPTDAGPKSGAASPGAALTVSDIRIGHQPGFDRVVFALGGTGSPGWQVSYTDRAVQDGSGKTVDVAGRAILEVRILGSAYPFDSVVPPFAGPDPVTDPSAPAITGVYKKLVYEGVTQSFIGIDADQPPFAVTTLADPPRLVVDIATQ